MNLNLDSVMVFREYMTVNKIKSLELNKVSHLEKLKSQNRI